MQGQDFLTQALVYLAAAVFTVPVARRLGLGSVLGYVLAGVVIGPYGLALVGIEGQDLMHVAEFGVVMMLFLIGLELRPAVLWRMRWPVLGLGGLQVALTAAVIAAVAVAAGSGWRQGTAIGLILALSSTAMVLQTLAEKGLMQAAAGRKAFAVLLFQDMAVIPILALLPLLSAPGPAATGPDSHGWIGGQPEWVQGLAVLGAVALVVGGSRFLVNPALRFIARARLRELLAAGSLLLVIAIARLMTEVGLSPALGTFLAGVVLAGSEYRHELESQMEVFKGLMLGLFFIAVGAALDLGLVMAEPGSMAGLVAALVIGKFAVLVILSRVFRMGLDQGLLFALALAQGGEFAFVLFSFSVQHRVLEPGLAARLVAAVGLSMALTPLLLLLHEKLLQPRIDTRERELRPADEMQGGSPVIIAGFGRFGHIVARLLRANGVAVTVLDFDSDQVDFLRRLGLEVYYGDAGRPDLLEAAGGKTARIMVVAVGDPEATLRIVETARRHFPHLRLLVRARNRAHAYELLEAGVERVYRETLDTSLRVGMDALRESGFRSYRAWRAVRAFRRHDEASVRALARHRHDRRLYMTRARQQIQEVERIMRAEFDSDFTAVGTAWDTSSLRAEAEGGGPAPKKKPG